MDDERHTALHVFEAASFGYLAYDRLVKREKERQAELQRQRDREYYTTNVNLFKVLSLDFANEPIGNVEPVVQGMVSGQAFMVIQQAYNDGAQLTITWESELDEKLHTDTMYVEGWTSNSLTVYRKRTEDEIASFDKFRSQDAYNAYVAERAEFHRLEAERAAHEPWYKRMFRS